MTIYNVLDTRRNIVGTYPEYTKFASYRAPCGITWIPLQIGEKKVRFFESSLLQEVAVTPVEKAAAQLALDIKQAAIEWNWPHVFLTPDKAASVNASAHVRICIVKPVSVVISLWHESMIEQKAA